MKGFAWIALVMGIAMCAGCSEGVAFCEDKISWILHENDAHVWNDGMATYVVNKRHEYDPQVKELVETAHKLCAKYY